MKSDVQQYIERYEGNYELWMKEIMDADITADQRCLATALYEHNFVSGKSGTTTGKTSGGATIALHFLTTRPESKIVCTAPTGHQLEDLLFAEMESWIRRIKLPFIQEAIKVIKGKIYIDGYRDWFIAARTIPKDGRDKLGDVLAGFHAPSLLFLVDEASGVPDAVFSGIEGSMIQKNVYCLLVGNPTRASGYFYDTHNKNKASWKQVTLSSTNSPFVNQDWVERMRNLYGSESDWFRTKVLGEFPHGEGQVLANYDQLNEAFARHERFDTDSLTGIMKVAGLDPGEGRNDSSVLTMRQANYFYAPIRIKHKDTNDLVTKVHNYCISEGVKELYVEYNGIGIAIFDQLKVKGGYKTFKVVPNARANDPEAYRNIRAELTKEMSNVFDEIAIAYHERYVQEIPEVSFMPDKEPLQVIGKGDLKNRLGFSPDFYASLMACTYRHFNFDRLKYSQESIAGFEAINSQLTQESEFEFI